MNKKKSKVSTDNIGKNSLIILIFIGVLSLSLRFYNFPWGLPVTLDALAHFWYANDLSVLRHFPTTNVIGNNGWPTFLSVFFMMIHSNNFIDYTTVQRFVSIAISTLTIIPIYLLCRRFFDVKYAIVGAAIFAFEPRIIQNSVLGITEPLYIFLISFSLFLFLSSDRKITYASFLCIGLATLVRSESLFLLLVFSIMFFVRFRSESKLISKYLFAVLIFILTLLPMSIIRLLTFQSDAIFYRLSGEAINISALTSTNEAQTNIFLYFLFGLQKPILLLAWAMIPVFLVFIIPGLIIVFRSLNQKTLTILLTLGVMLIPAIYAFSWGSDTRYFFPLYPSLIVISVFAIKQFSQKIRREKPIIVFVICCILFASFLFLDLKKVDLEHKYETLRIAYEVSNRTKITNQYLPESEFVVIPEITKLERFPIPSTDFSGEPKTILIKANSINEYLKKAEEVGMTHLVIDNIVNQNRPIFFKDIFEHEENYTFLKKEFDSVDAGYKYHLKIFRIDYAKFKLENPNE